MLGWLLLREVSARSSADGFPGPGWGAPGAGGGESRGAGPGEEGPGQPRPPPIGFPLGSGVNIYRCESSRWESPCSGLVFFLRLPSLSQWNEEEL